MADDSTLGYIYVVEMEGQGLYKIGKTSDVRRRLTQFGIQPPFPYRLRLAHRVKDMHDAERRFHRLFRADRLNGEWFRLTPTHLTFIRSCILVWEAEDLLERLCAFLLDVVHDIDKADMEKTFRQIALAKRRVERRVSSTQTLDYDLFDGRFVVRLMADLQPSAEVVH